MKFSEMPYSRPDVEALAAATAQTLEAMKAAPDAAGQIAAYDAFEKKVQTAGTMQQLAYIRHTINTKDEFYNAENDYMDEIGPKLQELTHQVNTALLKSPYRAELFPSTRTCMPPPWWSLTARPCRCPFWDPTSRTPTVLFAGRLMRRTPSSLTATARSWIPCMISW